MLRRLLGPKRDEIVRDRRKMRNDELYNLCSSIIIRFKVKEDGIGRAWSMHVIEL
jgi:hypothetical protein